MKCSGINPSKGYG